MDPYLIQSTLLLVISLVCMLAIVACTGSSPNNDKECAALFQFKKSIIQQDHEALCAASWLQTFHSWKPISNASNDGFNCCRWYGVECSSNDKYGHVIGLDLSENSLCGHINSSITLFNLVYLQKLNLANNNFSESQIPSEIVHLKQLRSLNLSNSGFSGIIPNEISQLKILSSIDLSKNALKLQSPSGLKNLLQNLTGLEELHLSGVDISSSVPHFLANLSSLRSIMLQDCSLQNEFPSAVLELPKLKILDVSYNTDLTGSFQEFRNSSLLEHVNVAFTGFFGVLPKSISNLKHLTFLSLNRCHFSGHTPGSPSNMTQLTNLGLAGNMFTGLVPSLEGLLKLNTLQLTEIKFEKGCFPNWLGKLSELNELYVGDTKINCEIPSFLGNLTKLSYVDLSNNSLIGHIPSSFFNLTRLTFLSLSYNQLQGPMPSSISNFRSLRDLRLHRNNFSGKVDLDLFLGLNKLQGLTLAYNRISLVSTKNYTNTTLPELEHLDLASCNLKEFPTFLRFQNNMTNLVLNNNKIEGLVPLWIWNNSQETMEYVDLSYNSIIGFHQHPHLLPWRNLQVFAINNNQVQGNLPIPPRTTLVYNAANNNLTGEIPRLICEMESLGLLELSSNNMSGTLPSCLGCFSKSLLALSLRRNNFHGIIMDTFMHGCLLESIDLSENGFVGHLPRSLTNCTNLEALSLRDNSFHDVFPFWLGTLANLQVLVLRSNKFYGPIHGSTAVCSQFPKLRIIDLSNNSFSGQLHQKFFQTWNSMKSVYAGESSIMESKIYTTSFVENLVYMITLIHKGVKTEYVEILTIVTAIDLSCNHFEGEIPLSLQDLEGLESLNLSNNHFSGRVLPSLGYLKNLEALDLSRNELSGEIPQQLVELGFLSIFNVSFNNLEGHIPRGKQFDTFENNSYMGNSRLCGQPLTKECQGFKASRLPPASNTSECLLPSERIDWIIIFCGVGSGLVVGVVSGNFLYERYSDRFIKRKDKWVRPLRNTRRNQGGVIS